MKQISIPTIEYNIKLSATLDKGLRINNLGTNLKQIEPWIGRLFPLKKVFFLKLQWVCLKAWGPIWGFNIKNVWLTCERIGFIFGLFSFLFFLVFFSFYSYYTQCMSVNTRYWWMLFLLWPCIKWLHKWLHCNE